MSEIELSGDAFEENVDTYNEVIRLIVFGKDQHEIENLTNVPPKVQRQFYTVFMNEANNQTRSIERQNALAKELDVSFSHLISDMEKVKNQADSDGDTKTTKDAIKEMANIIKMRFDTLQKTGLINIGEIGEEIARFEREREILMSALKEMRAKWPEAAKFVFDRVQQIVDEGEVI